MLFELREAFEDRNMFLVVLLGLLSAADQLDDYLRSAGIHAAAEKGPRDRLVRRDEASEQVLDAVLGVMSFLGAIRRHATVAAGSGAAAPSERVGLVRESVGDAVQDARMGMPLDGRLARILV